VAAGAAARADFLGSMTAIDVLRRSNRPNRKFFGGPSNGVLKKSDGLKDDKTGTIKPGKIKRML
jgi:hypothetical protein